MNKKKGSKLYEEMDFYNEQQKERHQEYLQRVILNAIYSLKLPQPISRCYKKINLTKLPNFSEKIVGQIVGKGGNHKNDFTQITGVNLELDKESEHCVILSKYNPIDVEKAKMLIIKLLKKSNWTWEHMKNHYEKVEEEFKQSCILDGTKILKNYLKYSEFTDRLAEIVGLLRYSYSYSQNILDHCLEVAQLCANVASQISLDVLMAKRAGFFHDVGKSIANHDDHVKVGVSIAKSEKLDDYILNAIESHHGKVKTDNPYSVLVKAMDKISAGRIGARPFQMELIKKRTTSITDALMKLPWIDKVILKNAGNLIQIFIKFLDFGADKIQEMKEQIKEVLTNMKYTYQYNYEIEFKFFYHECFLFDDIKSTNIDKDVENPKELGDITPYLTPENASPDEVVDFGVDEESTTNDSDLNKKHKKFDSNKIGLKTVLWTVPQWDKWSQKEYPKPYTLIDKQPEFNPEVKKPNNNKEKNPSKNKKPYKTYKKRFLSKAKITKPNLKEDKAEVRHGNTFIANE